MEALTQVLEDCDREDVGNVDKAIKFWDEEYELDREREQMTQYPTQDFATARKYKK